MLYLKVVEIRSKKSVKYKKHSSDSLPEPIKKVKKHKDEKIIESK